MTTNPSSALAVGRVGAIVSALLGAAAIAAGGASLYFGMLGAAMAGVLAALLALKKHTERVGSARPEGETTKD